MFNSFFKEQRKNLYQQVVQVYQSKSPTLIINTNNKLTTSMKATKAMNVQIRLLVEESQQLNSRK